MQTREILYEVKDHVATITLNRPEKLNAWTQVMEQEVRAAMEAAAADGAVRTIVVTGAGRGFCAGADLDRMKASLESGKRGTLARHEAATDGITGIEVNYQQRFSYLLRVPKPIIAAINGPVAGIGLCFVLFTDLRYIAPSAKVTTAFARRGLIAEHGMSFMLPRLIGLMPALDLLYSARVDRRHRGGAPRPCRSLARRRLLALGLRESPRHRLELIAAFDGGDQAPGL